MPLTAFRPRPDQGAAAEDPNQAQTNLLAIPVDVITSHVIPALPGSCRRRLRVTCRALRRAVDCSVASLLVDRPGVRASTFPGLTHIRVRQCMMFVTIFQDRQKYGTAALHTALPWSWSSCTVTPRVNLAHPRGFHPKPCCKTALAHATAQQRPL